MVAPAWDFRRMIDIASGHAAIDRFLADGYERVRGNAVAFRRRGVVTLVRADRAWHHG